MTESWNYLSPDEMAEYERLKAESAARNAPPAPAVSPFNDEEPVRVQLERMASEQLRDGGGRDEALAHSFDAIARAALAGDRRVVIQP